MKKAELLYDKLEFDYLQWHLKLMFKYRITFLAGDSATGKTFIAKALAELSSVPDYKIVVIDYRHTALLDVITSFENRLIVLDNEELLMTDELREFILSSKNQFLLIGRNCEGFPVPWDAFCVPKISKNLIEFERMYNGVSFNYGR